MDTDICKVNNRLNADALLPPRKRLLAGLKRQNSEITSPSPSKDNTPFNNNNPFIPQLSNSNLSNEGIVEASRIAAIESAKIAAAARAKAEEKAEKAAKAFSAARNALDIVATLSDEAAKKGKCLKMKTKKHTTVEELYNKKRKCGGTGNSKTDEELARNLHRAINSSPRILKNSDTKIHKHKRTKDKSDQLMLNNGEGGKNKEFKVGDSEVLDKCGRKRGRIKQKKLPLSVCSFRDRTGLKEDGVTVGTNGDLFSSGNKLGIDERRSMWKCQSLKVTSCVQQNKVMEL